MLTANATAILLNSVYSACKKGHLYAAAHTTVQVIAVHGNVAIVATNTNRFSTHVSNLQIVNHAITTTAAFI